MGLPVAADRRPGRSRGSGGGLNLAGLAQDHRSLDAILQLPHVARPMILPEGLLCLGRERHCRFLEVLAESVDEIARQNLDVLPSVPKRRDCDRKYRQSEVQVLTEQTRRDCRAEIPVCCRHEANIHLQGHDAPNPLESSLLDHS